MTFLWKNNAENHPTNSRYQELTLFMKKVMQLDVRCTGLVSFSWIKIKTLKEATQKLFYFQLILRNPPSLFSKSISHCFPFPFKVYLMHILCIIGMKKLFTINFAILYKKVYNVCLGLLISLAGWFYFFSFHLAFFLIK